MPDFYLRPCGCDVRAFHADDCPWHPARRGLVSWFRHRILREWMIGWHQGHRERAERDLRRHADSELKWRLRG